MKLTLGILALGLASAAYAQTAAVPQPPVAKKVHTERTLNGATLTDDYAWLRQKTSPDVVSYLESENKFAEAMMAPTLPLQQKLYDEMLGHIKETDDSVPYFERGWYYYSRTEKGKQYPILCRKKGSLDSPEQIMVDENASAQGEKFFSLSSRTVSDDGNLLAYSTDTVGFRQYNLHIRDLRTGKDLPDTAERVDSIAWTADNQTLFYVVEDPVEKRAYRLYRHRVGAAQDDLVFEEKDERFNIGVERSRSGGYLFLEIESHITSEARYLPAATPGGEWKLIEPRKDEIRYKSIDHRGGFFYIAVNDTGKTFRLVSAPVSSPEKSHWKEIIPARPDIAIEDASFFRNFFVLTERVNGLPAYRVFPFTSPDSDETAASRTISLPEPTYNSNPVSNADFEAKAFRYAYTSLVTPPSTFDYEVASGQSILKKQAEVPNFDRARYASERVFATASDGTKIPISLVYRKDLKTAGRNPLFQYAYGSYGFAMPVTFSAARLALLDRGVVYAIAHIRGGGEFGEAWHDAGKMMTKRNTFTDFIACTEFLTAHGYGDPKRVAIHGGSAGGLLMGAVTNMRPDLYRVVVAEVPFVDVMNTMLDPSLPLTVPEYEEWGNPEHDPAFHYMLSYSPYDNVAAKPYPAILVRTSFNDSQVMYWEPAKYVARLRATKTDKNPLLFRINMNAGHGGRSGRYDYLHDLAFNYAFVLTQLGLESPGVSTSD
jgi:oligopeptidase B